MHQLKTRGERLHLGWLLKELVRDGLLTQADATSGLVLWRVEKQQLPLSQLKALAESQITVLDVVNHDISAAAKAERMRKFHLAGFSQNYRLITSPQGEAGIKHTQRRVRDWLETRFKKF